MPGNFKKEDLRIVKTHRALVTAMAQVLELRNFNQITVHDLCEEAQISRATFYAHFADKYDLLSYWLRITQAAIVNRQANYEEIEKSVNAFAASHYRVIRNLLEDANPETAELLRDFILSLLELPNKKNASGSTEARHTVLHRFCAGGIYNYLLWQVNNKFPENLPLINRHLYDIVSILRQTCPE